MEQIEDAQLAYRHALDNAQSGQDEVRRLTEQRDQEIAVYQARLRGFVGEQTPVYVRQLMESADQLYTVQKYCKLIREYEHEMELKRR